jgi:hypothetical protein
MNRTPASISRSTEMPHRLSDAIHPMAGPTPNSSGPDGLGSAAMPRIAVAISSICGSISVMDREPMLHDGWNDPVDVRPYNARLILRTVGR